MKKILSLLISTVLLVSLMVPVTATTPGNITFVSNPYDSKIIVNPKQNHDIIYANDNSTSYKIYFGGPEENYDATFLKQSTMIQGVKDIPVNELAMSFTVDKTCDIYVSMFNGYKVSPINDHMSYIPWIKNEGFKRLDYEGKDARTFLGNGDGARYVLYKKTVLATPENPATVNIYGNKDGNINDIGGPVFIIFKDLSINLSNYVFKGKSGVLGDENIYTYTFGNAVGSDISDEIGVELYGKKFPLDEKAMNITKTNGKFGIGIADPLNILKKDTFEFIPYMKIGASELKGDLKSVPKNLVETEKNTNIKDVYFSNFVDLEGAWNYDKPSIDGKIEEGVYDYTVSARMEDDIPAYDLNVILEDPGATYNVVKKATSYSENVTTIEVTAKDGVTKNLYNFTYRKLGNDKKATWVENIGTSNNMDWAGPNNMGFNFNNDKLTLSKKSEDRKVIRALKFDVSGVPDDVKTVKLRMRKISVKKQDDLKDYYATLNFSEITNRNLTKGLTYEDLMNNRGENFGDIVFEIGTNEDYITIDISPESILRAKNDNGKFIVLVDYIDNNFNTPDIISFYSDVSQLYYE